MSIKWGNPSFCVHHWIRIWLMFCSRKILEKICSKQVVECDCKLPSLLSLIPMQSSGKHAQNNIATNPGEFQKSGTKRYQSDKLSLEFKIIILETLILNSRTKSDSTAVLSERFPSECVRSICVCGTAIELFPAPAVLRGQAWAIRCDRECWAAAAAVFSHRTGALVSVQCQGSFISPMGLSCPGALLRLLKERKGNPFCSELSILCCVSAASAAFPPQPGAWS